MLPTHLARTRWKKLPSLGGDVHALRHGLGFGRIRLGDVMCSIGISIHVSWLDNRVFLIKENVGIGLVDEFGHVVSSRRLHATSFH